MGILGEILLFFFFILSAQTSVCVNYDVLKPHPDHLKQKFVIIVYRCIIMHVAVVASRAVIP